MYIIISFDEMYTFPCHDRGHINVVLVLQSCSYSLQDLPSTSSGTFPTSSDGTYGVGNIWVEEDVHVTEERSIVAEKDADTGIRQEEITEEVNIPDKKSEPV
jgi:hypothetical protein